MTDAVTDSRVREALAGVVEPDTALPVTELGMVRGVVVGRRRVQVALALPVVNHPLAGYLREKVDAAVGALGVDRVDVDIIAMTDDDRRRLRETLHGPKGEQRQPFASARVIAVSSGKGGVGWASRRSRPTWPSFWPAASRRSH